MVKASSIGSGLGSFFNNPGVVGIAAIAIGLFLFRDKISNFFQSGVDSIGAGIGDINVNLPAINFPTFEFPTIELPTFNFDFGDTFKGIQDSLDKIFVQFSNLDQPGREMGSTPDPDVIPDFSGRGTRPDPVDQGPIINPEGTIPLDPNRPLSLDQLAAFARPSAIAPQIVQSAIPDQQFFGGGPSFISGSVSEIPLERLSLGNITEMLGISASAAASLRAEAIGFTPEETAFLSQGQELSPLGDLGPQTSGGFEGLTPEEVALRLTGGLISNF